MRSPTTRSSKKDRKKLHLSAARYFESLGTDEIAGALASHYLAAQASAAEGEESDALAGQARIALKSAAARARSLGSFDQAVAFAEQAISVTTDPADRVELMLAAAEDARIAGRLDHAEKLLTEAMTVARDSGNNAQALKVTTALGVILAAAFRTDEALALVAPALDEFDGEDEELLTDLRLVNARVLFLKNQFTESLSTLDGLLPVAERRGLVWIVAVALIAKANSLWSLGRRREAFGMAYAARDLAIEHGMTDVLLRVMANLANVLTEKDVQLSMAASREQIELARKAGRRGQLLNSVGNFGYTSFLAGEWDIGLAEMERYLAEDMSGRDRLIMMNNALIIRAGRGEQIDDGLAEMTRLGESHERALADVLCRSRG